MFIYGLFLRSTAPIEADEEIDQLTKRVYPTIMVITLALYLCVAYTNPGYVQGDEESQLQKA